MWLTQSYPDIEGIAAMLLSVPFAAFFLALIAGHQAMSRGRGAVLAGLAALLAALGGWAFWREATTPGLDVLLYTLLIWGAVLPGLVALGLGALAGRFDPGARQAA
ncbi:hypothetical protein P279_28035 [Rhodobacteraceae bacterium PD-2]|nr:hypothetical protein P279_28035 [Rhodobacteraceae bacterium PD-2]